jgi:hypothetical protein
MFFLCRPPTLSVTSVTKDNMCPFHAGFFCDGSKKSICHTIRYKRHSIRRKCRCDGCTGL